MPKSRTAVVELIPHTADVGIEVRAPTLDELFVAAAQGFTKVLITNPSAVRPRTSIDIELEGTDLADLLVRWLAELLYLFEVERMLFSRYQLRVDQTGIRMQAQAKGEPYDPHRHHAGLEIKAVTYHEARVELTADGTWHARVIFDV